MKIKSWYKIGVRSRKCPLCAYLATLDKGKTMISIGAKNKHHLIELLKKKLDRYIESIPDKMIHNFSHKDPDLIVELRINHNEFEVMVLREENEILRKRLERAKTPVHPAVGEANQMSENERAE